MYRKKMYNSNIPFIFSTHIREYDIQKANINILYEAGVINLNEYNMLYSAPRMERQIYIGLLQKSNPKVVEILSDGIIEAKRKLFESNDIKPEDVLCIKNDAVFIINKILNNTKFGCINFVCKNEYTSFMKCMNIEFYYKLDRVNGTDKLDIKGLGNKNIDIHKDYMSDFISYIFNIIETDSIEYVISSFKSFYNSYVNLELPVGYYRNYDPISGYNIMNSNYVVYDVNDTYDDKRNLNISYNLNILKQIYSYITTIYFNNNRGV